MKRQGFLVEARMCRGVEVPFFFILGQCHPLELYLFDKKRLPQIFRARVDGLLGCTMAGAVATLQPTGNNLQPCPAMAKYTGTVWRAGSDGPKEKGSKETKR